MASNSLENAIAESMALEDNADNSGDNLESSMITLLIKLLKERTGVDYDDMPRGFKKPNPTNRVTSVIPYVG